MSIELQFNQIAQEYDANRKKFIPCFDDYYQSTTAFIAANINPPKNIVDLGSGTGLLAYYWYQHFPDANYLLVDIVDDMLNVAKRRFCEVDNVSYQLIDYTKELPNALFDTVISALSIHHLTHSEKQALFAKIYQALPKNGVFVNYDQFCAGDNQINLWYEHYWENYLTHSGLTDKDLALWQERRKLDKECSVEEECAMLKQSGFITTKCVYTHQKFSVIVALK